MTITAPCPNCGNTDHSSSVREPDQDGRTRCGSCLVATPNRNWPDFQVELSPVEVQAQAAKQLALIGMACISAEEVEMLAKLSEVAASGDTGTLTHAFAAIVAGYACKKYEGDRQTRKKVNGAISTVRAMRANPPSVH